MGRHDELLAGIYTALTGDPTRPAEAIRAALLMHTSQPAPTGAPQEDCATCVGTGIGLVNSLWLHCCCGCAVCSCGQFLCDGQGGQDGCDTVEALADALGVVVHAGGSHG